MPQALLLPFLPVLALSVGAQMPPAQGPPPACEEGVRAARQSPYPVPPPVFVRRLEAPRLIIFVHGLHGDATASWSTAGGVYWPTLVASDPAFRDFDIFVHEYVVKPTGPVRLEDAADQFVQVASKHGLVSRYRDVVFVTEGDGVYFVRELLKRVRPFAARATMIFVAGRLNEVANPVKTDTVQMIQGKGLFGWQEFMLNDAQDWLFVEPKPWTHCAVLDSRTQTVDRDAASSFCSTMPLSIPGSDWRSLRPSCYADPVYQAFRRSVGQYGLQTAQAKALPPTTITADSAPVTVPCQQTLERIIEVPIAINPATEVVLSSEASVIRDERLKAFNAVVERVVGNVVLVRYVLAGLDLAPGALLTGQAACPQGQATIRVSVLKRPKD